MSRRWASDVAPSGTVAAFFDNAAHGWGYDRHSAENQIRAQSLRLRNLVDEGLGAYGTQLRETLRALRRELPVPTRESPLPPADALSRLRGVEGRIREVEDLRTLVQGLPLPSRDIVWRSKEDHLAFLDRLRALDLELLTACSEASGDFLDRVKRIMARRESLLAEYIAFRD